MTSSPSGCVRDYHLSLSLNATIAREIKSAGNHGKDAKFWVSSPREYARHIRTTGEAKKEGRALIVKQVAYLYAAVFLVRRPIKRIWTVFNKVTSDPLVVIVSPLSNHFNNYLRLSEIKLYPLSTSVNFSRPPSWVATALLVMEAREPCCVVPIPYAGRRDVAVAKTVVGQSKGFGDGTTFLKVESKL